MRILSLQLLFVLLVLSPVNAEELEQGIRVVDVSSQEGERVFYMDAQIETHLPQYISDAVLNGVPLPLLLQIEVRENKNWWFDRSLVTVEQRYLLRYYPLLDSFGLNNLTTGSNIYKSSLALALKTVGEIKGFPILDKEHFKTDGNIYARIRLKVDETALPKPLRTNSFLGGNWKISSEWKEWQL